MYGAGVWPIMCAFDRPGRRMHVAENEAGEYAEKVRQQVETAVKRMPEYEKLLKVYSDMLLAQHEAGEKLSPVEVDMDAGRAQVCMQAGMTLLGEVGAEHDVAAAVELFGKLKSVAAGHDEEFAAERKKIDAAIESGELNIAMLIEEAFAGGGVEELKKKALDLELDPHFLALLLFASIRPGLEHYSRRLRPMIDENDWEKRFCPVCGHLPYIARLEGQEGKRVLCCPACSAEWRFPRLRCINCGTESHEKLRMLFPQGHSRERYADVCDECKRYLKVVDTRNFASQPLMLLEDAATLHIDILAQQEGFVTL